MARLEIDWSKVPFRRASSTAVSPRPTGRCCFTLTTPSASLPPSIAPWLILTPGGSQTLAETYRTPASGIIYEKPLDYPLQRALYESLKAAIAEFREKEAQRWA